MPALALAVIAIALPDSLNPSLIAAAVYLALGPHPFRRTLVFTVAAFAVTLAGGVAIALGLGDLVLSLLPELSSTVKWTVLTSVGILLACGAIVLWWRRDSLVHRERRAHDSSSEHGSAALMGLGIAGIELVTAFPYFAAIALVLGSSESPAGKAFLLVLYDLVYVLPLIAIVLVCAVMGARAGRLLAPANDWFAAHWPILVAPLAGAAGVALTGYGVVQLA